MWKRIRDIKESGNEWDATGWVLTSARGADELWIYMWHHPEIHKVDHFIPDFIAEKKLESARNIDSEYKEFTT